jgi:hypothetical protein
MTHRADLGGQVSQRDCRKPSRQHLARLKHRLIELACDSALDKAARTFGRWRHRQDGLVQGVLDLTEADVGQYPSQPPAAVVAFGRGHDPGLSQTSEGAANDDGVRAGAHGHLFRRHGLISALGHVQQHVKGD